MDKMRKEGLICGAIWSAFVCYMCWSTYVTSKRLESSQILKPHLHDGWKFIARQQDVSDVEWLFWKLTLIPKLIPWVLVHLIISFCFKEFQMVKKCFSITLTVVFMLTHVGFVSCVFFMTQALVIVSAALMLRSKLFVWTVGIFFLSFVFAQPLRDILRAVSNTHRFDDVMLFDYILTLGMLRYTSCALCIIDAIKQKDTSAVEKLIGIKIRDVRAVSKENYFQFLNGASIIVRRTRSLGSVNGAYGKLNGKVVEWEERWDDGEVDGRNDGSRQVRRLQSAGKDGDKEEGEDLCDQDNKKDNALGEYNEYKEKGAFYKEDTYKKDKAYKGDSPYEEDKGYRSEETHKTEASNKRLFRGACMHACQPMHRPLEAALTFDSSKEEWLVEADWGLILTYVCYLPVFAFGPFLTYDSFCHQFKKVKSTSRRSNSSGNKNDNNNSKKDNINLNRNNSDKYNTNSNNNNSNKDKINDNNNDNSNKDNINNNNDGRRQMLTKVFVLLTKAALWSVVLEVTNHLTYHHAIVSTPKLMWRLPLWSVAGSAYMSGQVFMLKYFILWSFSSSLALLDGIVTPAPPACISHIYLYSDMWKYFDKGFYEFLKNYIYIPLGGQKQGLLTQSPSLVVPFVFVFLWHGAYSSIGIWTAMNVLALFVEKLLNSLFHSPSFLAFCSSKLSAQGSRRLQTLLELPLFGFSSASIFVFLASQHSAYILFHRFFISGFPVSFILLAIAGFCFVQFSKSRKDLLPKHHH